MLTHWSYVFLALTHRFYGLSSASSSKQRPAAQSLSPHPDTLLQGFKSLTEKCHICCKNSLCNRRNLPANVHNGAVGRRVQIRIINLTICWSLLAMYFNLHLWWSIMDFITKPIWYICMCNLRGSSCVYFSLWMSHHHQAWRFWVQLNSVSRRQYECGVLRNWNGTSMGVSVWDCKRKCGNYLSGRFHKVKLVFLTGIIRYWFS